ncbi:DUF5719 family protein [Streptomyces sp. NPDC003077]|uniref:DUF5719 family protein n=1 Tax=Streptomyces sp. NPDC003077 TaxID=3154443 RepID=UPI0033B58FAB
MNRNMLPFVGAVVAIAAVTGVAALAGPGGTAETTVQRGGRLPVERSALLCPASTPPGAGNTTYVSFAPGSADTRARLRSGTAELLPLVSGVGGNGRAGESKGKDDKKNGKNSEEGKARDTAKPVVPLLRTGKPATATTDQADAPALAGIADGALAPGWSVQQTTAVPAGKGRGLLGVACAAPDTDFWFPGVSTARERQDYVHLTNPDAAPAVVDLRLHGPDGPLPSSSGEGVIVPPHSSVPVLLSTLTGSAMADAALHVTAREGRVGAAVQAADAGRGGDWLPAAVVPARGVVLPGIPADAASVHLVAVAAGGADADVEVRLATPSGTIAPAGLESLHVKSGMTTVVDLGSVTKSEPGSLVLRPADGSRGLITAALRVTRGKGSKQEVAFIPATRPVGARATAADNRSRGGTLSLVAPGPGKAVTVKVTASAGSGGGTSVAKTYTVEGGSTLAVDPPVPSGLKGSYALTVEPEAGGGPLYAARTLTLPHGGVPAFTIQALPDDRGTIAVPAARQDLSLLTD